MNTFLGLLLYLLIDISGVNNNFVLSALEETKDGYRVAIVNDKPSSPKQNRTSANRHKISLNPYKQFGEVGAISSNGLYSVDTRTGTVLEAKNENQKLQIASLTKLMTAYIILEENSEKLESQITVPRLNTRLDDATMGLTSGESLTTKDLLRGLLINSGSDAALTLSIANSGNTDLFIEKMNHYAQKLGLENTHFNNPVGWDDPDNYSSAKDIANLSRILINNSLFTEITSTKDTVVYTAAGRGIPLTNTNKLLTQGFTGIKTGYTNNAGECLVALSNTNNNQILTVIIGSNNRFGETTKLRDWIFSHYLW